MQHRSQINRIETETAIGSVGTEKHAAFPQSIENSSHEDHFNAQHPSFKGSNTSLPLSQKTAFASPNHSRNFQEMSPSHSSSSRDLSPTHSYTSDASQNLIESHKSLGFKSLALALDDDTSTTGSTSPQSPIHRNRHTAAVNVTSMKVPTVAIVPSSPATAMSDEDVDVVELTTVSNESYNATELIQHVETSGESSQHILSKKQLVEEDEIIVHTLSDVHAENVVERITYDITDDSSGRDPFANLFEAVEKEDDTASIEHGQTFDDALDGAAEATVTTSSEFVSEAQGQDDVHHEVSLSQGIVQSMAKSPMFNRKSVEKPPQVSSIFTRFDLSTSFRIFLLIFHLKHIVQNTILVMLMAFQPSSFSVVAHLNTLYPHIPYYPSYPITLYKKIRYSNLRPLLCELDIWPCPHMD